MYTLLKYLSNRYTINKHDWPNKNDWPRDNDIKQGGVGRGPVYWSHLWCPGIWWLNTIISL